METIFLQDSKLKAGICDGQITIKRDDELLGSYPIVPLRQIAVFGNPQITTQAIKACMEYGVEIQYYTIHGKFLGMMNPAHSKNSLRRLAQYEVASSPALSLEWSRSLIRGKLKEYEVEYRRIRDNGWHKPQGKFLSQVRKYKTMLSRASDIETIRGIEGMAARCWFQFFGESLPPGWNWCGRSYHPPEDEVNALLSLFYGLSGKELENQCRMHGLDPEISFMHRNGYGSGGLATDLIENFRITECDHHVLKLLHHGKMKTGDFICDGRQYKMSSSGWEKVIRIFDEVLRPGYIKRCEEAVLRVVHHLEAREIPVFETLQAAR